MRGSRLATLWLLLPYNHLTMLPRQGLSSHFPDLQLQDMSRDPPMALRPQLLWQSATGHADGQEQEAPGHRHAA